MVAAKEELIEVLEAAKQLLSIPKSDFSWSSWTSAADAIRELDAQIAAISAGERPPRLDLTVLFAPTGPIQEISLSSGWGDDFLSLAARFDAAEHRYYA
jgi:hypothetical protein